MELSYIPESIYLGSYVHLRKLNIEAENILRNFIGSTNYSLNGKLANLLYTMQITESLHEHHHTDLHRNLLLTTMLILEESSFPHYRDLHSYINKSVELYLAHKQEKEKSFSTGWHLAVIIFVIIVVVVLILFLIRDTPNKITMGVFGSLFVILNTGFLYSNYTNKRRIPVLEEELKRFAMKWV